MLACDGPGSGSGDTSVHETVKGYMWVHWCVTVNEGSRAALSVPAAAPRLADYAQFAAPNVLGYAWVCVPVCVGVVRLGLESVRAGDGQNPHELDVID